MSRRLINSRLLIEELEPRLLLSVGQGTLPISDSMEMTIFDDNISIFDNIIDEPQEYKTSGFKWPQPRGLGTPVTITYSYSNLFDGEIETFTGVPMDTESLRSAMEEALGLWAQYAPLHFVEVIDSGPLPTASDTNYSAANHPDIRIGHHYIDGNPLLSETLAHASQPNGSGIGGDLHFDSGNLWFVDNIIFFDIVDIFEVATHEIGHTLGLSHEIFNTAIMNTRMGDWFNGLGTGFLFQDDISGIRSIYGYGVGSVTPLPDFEAIDVWVTTADRDNKITTARIGDKVEFHAWIKRQDLSGVPEAALSIYASNNAIYDNSDILLDTLSSRQLFTFPNSTGSIWHLSVEPLTELTPGSYYLIAYIDPANDVDEIDETNNIYVSPIRFIVQNEVVPPSAPGALNLVTDNGLLDSDNITNDNTPMFSWTASVDNSNGSGVAGYQWRIDGGNWSNLQTLRNTTTGTLSDGTYQFYVRASDNAGNIGPTSSLTFMVDTLLPGAPGSPDLITDSGLSALDNITNIVASIFTWSSSIDNSNGSGVADYQWRVDNGSWSYWQATLDAITSPLQNGAHMFYARARDIAGNISPETSLEFLIDSAGPTITNASPLGTLAEKFDHLDVTFNEVIDSSTLSPNDAQVSGLLYSFQGTAIQALTETSYRIQFHEQDKGGNYIITVGPQITDLAGNTMSQSFVGQFSLPVKVLVGNKGAKRVSYQDDDGTFVTVQVVEGTTSVAFDGTNILKVNEKQGVVITGNEIQIANIEVIAGSTVTKLTVKAKGGNNQADLGGITGSFLGKLNAKGIDLTGNIDLTGSLGSMVVNDIFDNVTITTGIGIFNGFNLKANRIADNVVFDLTGTVKKFQANSYDGGAIVADSIGQVKINSGKFGADVKARNGDIKSVTSLHTITGDIMASGNIGKIIAKQGSFTGAARAGKEIGTIQAYSLHGTIISAGREVGKVNIKGNIIDSFILGGYDTGTDCAFGLQHSGGGDIPGSGNVISVKAKGMFANSYILAGTLPHSPLTDSALLDVGLPYVAGYGSIGKVKFGSVDLNATTDFGLFAATEIKPFKIGKNMAQSKGHFRVEVLS